MDFIVDKFTLWFGRTCFLFLAIVNIVTCHQAFNRGDYWTALFAGVVATFMVIMTVSYWTKKNKGQGQNDDGWN